LKEKRLCKMSIFGSFKREANETALQDKKNLSLIVKKSKCPQNHPCPSVRVCPVGALVQRGYDAPSVDEEKCIKCGKCVRFCPMKALVME
jgi:Fe-S-cluster-containing hydrogenase component 2